MPPTHPVNLNQPNQPLPPGVRVAPPGAVPPGFPPGPAPTVDPPAPPPPTAELCHHCGRDPQSDPEKIEAEDIIAFAQSVWRNEPFRKTYVLFGGAVQVTFRTLTTDQAQSAQRTVLALAARNEAPGGVLAMLSINDLAEEHQFALSVEKLQVSDKVYVPNAMQVNDSKASIGMVSATAGNHIAYQAIRKSYVKFFVLGRRLVDAGADPSFWEATLPSGPSPVSPTTAMKG